MTAAQDESKIPIALEAIECSNRCRHCETSYGPRRRHLSRNEIRPWADRIRMQAERLGIGVEIGLNNSELLDHPEWRSLLTDLGDESLGRAFATNGRRIAREPGIVNELRARGVEWLQLTLGGGSAEVHDWFTCRPGSFEDICSTARIAQAAGMHVCWVYVAYRPLAEVVCMSEVATAISRPYQAAQYAHKGGIDQGLFLTKPQGKGKRTEHLRPTLSDLTELPEWACREHFANWSGAGCETEAELVNALCNTGRRVGCLELGYPECCGYGLTLCRNGDVYPYCHERHPDFLLGNLNADGGMERVVEAFFGDSSPPALSIRRRGLAELAATYGDRTNETLHSGCSLCRTLVTRALSKEYP